jgi:DNA mismatch repair protein MutL
MSLTVSPPKIDLLPEHLIDQIKAGEVIERPGNLLKEILENAVDAGATKLEITLQNNGLDLIVLKDNGHGMRARDLPLAFSRHATSKISRFEHLYQLHSFGFRGEALASVAAISKIQCISFTKEDPKGAEIRIDGGKVIFEGERQKNSVEHGTELIIQDLFYNTPARLKFIQSIQSEKTFIKKVLYSFIYSHPEIEFQVKMNDEDKDIIPRTENLQERLENLIPKAKSQILFNERFYENNELQIYLIPGHLKAPLRTQYIFINSRYILDKQPHRVLCNALQAAFGHDDFHYVAFFNVPPDCIDVNVHPNKTIVKCMESSKMMSLLTSSVKEMATSRSAPAQAAPSSLTSSPSFNFEDAPAPTLLQERHEYNMEGIFSPHQLGMDASVQDGLYWIDHYFIREKWAYSAIKLIEAFVQTKIQSPAPQIPLLVSQPYSSLNVKPQQVQKLIDAGLELEALGADTLVLRSIPDWMNGFPLEDIVQNLLWEKPFHQMEIFPKDWSTSTWEFLIEEFSVEELIKEKIALSLPDLLKEKLR